MYAPRKNEQAEDKILRGPDVFRHPPTIPGFWVGTFGVVPLDLGGSGNSSSRGLLDGKGRGTTQDPMIPCLMVGFFGNRRLRPG